ncbi:MAG: hypothetical protein V9G15_05275 [Dermatophilaceae bacterium]
MRTLPLDHPGTPPVTGPGPFMRWVARHQWTSLALGMTYGITWMVSQALIPATIAKAIDEGIVAGDRAALWRWAGAARLGLAAVIADHGHPAPPDGGPQLARCLFPRDPAHRVEGRRHRPSAPPHRAHRRRGRHRGQRRHALRWLL